ncbi:MAG: AIM24 family protein [Lachnospiraceae bacterium]|nr:AIM24 family protein [Lachnospiraceae bacterium]
MITTNLLDDNIHTRILTDSKGIFRVLEYTRDLSVTPENAETAYFESAMSVRKRQLIADINPKSGVIAQKGTMQLMLGDLRAVTDVENVGSLVKKYVGSKVTGETAIKPRYRGEGTLVLEPTFRFIILEDLKEWENGMVIEDGLFLACEDSADLHVTARTTVSSAVFGREGLFNSILSGHGIVALESPTPRNELIEINMKDDVVKIDGNNAIAWSKSLAFTVERTTPTLVGSVMSGEGLVNTYRGSGKILVAPVREGRIFAISENDKNS